MRIVLILLVFALFTVLVGCAVERGKPVQNSDGRPQRIVSIDFCADQYVLKFVERERILAVSPSAEAEFSHMRHRARGLPTVRPVAEDVIVLKPDLVVRSYGGGSGATAMFRRAGVRVHNVSWAEDFPAILRRIRETAAALGSAAQGEAVANEVTSRLKAQRMPVPGTTALYMTPAGVTSGPGSLVHAMLTAAGLDNFQVRPGWRAIPLERLVYEQPGLVAAAFFDSPANRHAWSAVRHPIVQALLAKRPVVPIQGAWTACGGWFLADAVEALATGARMIETRGIAR